MTASERSPLARFTIFIVCLAIADRVVSGAHDYTVDFPQQKILQVPENTAKSTGSCATGAANCQASPDSLHVSIELRDTFVERGALSHRLFDRDPVDSCRIRGEGTAGRSPGRSGVMTGLLLSAGSGDLIHGLPPAPFCHRFAGR